MVIPVVLGGQGWSLSVLPIRANREWVALFNEQVRGKLNAVGPLESADQLADLIVASAETMMDLLIDYDRIGAKAWEQDPVLPDRAAMTGVGPADVARVVRSRGYCG